MNASRSPDELGRQAGEPRGGHPAPRKGKERSQFTWRATSAAILVAVTVTAILASACGGATAASTAASTSASTSIAGKWVGSGTISADLSGPIAFYLDLSTGADHRISGTGTGCASGVDARLTITGAPASAAGAYTMDLKTADLGPSERTLHVTAQVSSSQMTVSGIDTFTTPPTNVRATLSRPGTQAAFTALCNSQPTPASSS